jgi:hypothetical protein
MQAIERLGREIGSLSMGGVVERRATARWLGGALGELLAGFDVTVGSGSKRSMRFSRSRRRGVRIGVSELAASEIESGASAGE